MAGVGAVTADAFEPYFEFTLHSPGAPTLDDGIKSACTAAPSASAPSPPAAGVHLPSGLPFAPHSLYAAAFNKRYWHHNGPSVLVRSGQRLRLRAACEQADCTNRAQSSGSGAAARFCVRHGGGRRCAHAECARAAFGKTRYCVRHGGGHRCQVHGDEYAFPGCAPPHAPYKLGAHPACGVHSRPELAGLRACGPCMCAFGCADERTSRA
tara:strand:+ start:2900 stop:3529 length:630 start_codon:yes stop_codon:yes gene_type:complete